jgi:hypothetical protein
MNRAAARVLRTDRLGRGLRLWVLLAGLFCASALPLAESTHFHLDGDLPVFCQLCSGVSDASLAAHAPQTLDDVARHATASPHAVGCEQRAASPFQPRGPPAIS